MPNVKPSKSRQFLQRTTAGTRQTHILTIETSTAADQTIDSITGNLLYIFGTVMSRQAGAISPKNR
jgi:hypothetical protein